MTDRLSSLNDNLTAPSRSVLAVTPSDTIALPVLPKALYIGTAGDVTLRCVDDSADVVFRNVPAGGLIRARASHVRLTGTTASNILAHC